MRARSFVVCSVGLESGGERLLHRRKNYDLWWKPWTTAQLHVPHTSARSSLPPTLAQVRGSIRDNSVSEQVIATERSQRLA